MRQLVSTALVAVIVAALTAVTVGAVAQQPVEPGATSQLPESSGQAITTAGLDADTVDGRHAVKATTKKLKRRNKLVAADSSGFLPSNIVKPKWGLIQGMPEGFADGMDDVGYASETQPTAYPIAASDFAYATVDTPIGTDVELTIIPMTPGVILEVDSEWWERVDDGTLRHFYELRNGSTATTFKVRTRVYNAGIAPADFRKALRKVEVRVVTKAPTSRR